MKIKILGLIFVLLISGSGVAQAAGNDLNVLLTPWVVPLLGSALIDLEVAVETNVSEKSSLALGVTYFRKDCNDCSSPSTSSGKGITLYHRYYLDTISEGGWLVLTGIEYARARTKTSRTGLTTHDRGNIFSPELILGKRNYINQFFYEFGGGLYYRIGDVRAADTGGYKNGFGPVLHLALGYTF